MWLRFLTFPLTLLGGLLAAGLFVAGLVVALAYPNLPALDTLTDYQPKVPLRVYTAEGELIGEFGEERRVLVDIKDVPAALTNAIVAAEDERFYQHAGIDYVGVARAAYANLLTGGRRQGASTITMQVARNFFLSSEKTLTRKLYEVLLAVKIERNLSKDQILGLYVNQIYLGQRAYGFASAARTYFGKPLDKLTLAEAAMLAALPKAPSSYNPIANPQRAKQRQLYVLRRMRELGYITADEFDSADAAPIITHKVAETYGVRAEYVAEMVRQAVYEQYPEDAYSRGFRVYTTIRKADQEAALEALRNGLMEYDRRLGYRGPEAFVELAAGADEADFEEALAEREDDDDLRVALVTQATRREVKAVLKNGEAISITGDGLRFAAPSLQRVPAQRRIRRGAIVRLRALDAKRWEIVQVPETEAAFIAMDPVDGAIRALVGGFQFYRSKFNHVTQAWRQAGSAFKPFIYSAALERGFTAATVVPDEPIAIEADVTGSQRWEPKNFDGKFEGPMTMRSALVKSKNMVSIRILDAIGVKYAQDYITRFGFEGERHPPYLTMALGSGTVTPWQMARAYAVFANGGYLVQPYFIQKIVDDRGNPLGVARPQRAGDESLRVIDRRNAFIMDSLMQDVARVGTAARTASLGRKDVAGKTGTTNEFIDAWFAGYLPSLVGVSWVGYDQPRSLGRNQTGGLVALPIWVGYMQKVQKAVPEMQRIVPDGVVTADTFSLDPGMQGDAKHLPEYFYREFVPKDDTPPFPLLPVFVPPPEEAAIPEIPSVPGTTQQPGSPLPQLLPPLVPPQAPRPAPAVPPPSG
ncbi:MAG: PBP1A family penicillin-binding protein [Betaproteobacteria bacterium]|nr:PBP1A family penicillin-binding protein [Betaproteobacteria bacterium]